MMYRFRVIVESNTEVALYPQYETISRTVIELRSKPDIVTARLDRYDDDIEPPEPPIVVYAKPVNAGGVHICPGGRTGYGSGGMLDRCAQAGKPVGLVKVLAEDGAAMEAKTYSPLTFTVYRKPVPDGEGGDDDNPPGNWHWPATQTPSIVRAWMDKQYQMWSLVGPGVIDFFEIENEPNLPEPDPAPFEECRDMALRHAEFMLGCMIDAEVGGHRLAIGSFSSGCPTEFELDYYLDVFDYAARHGHVLSLHDGSTNDERPNFQQAAEDGCAFRWRMIRDRMTAAGKAMPYVVVTECYRPNGYRNFNADVAADFRWYLDQCELDDRLLGVAYFTLGDYEFAPGQSVNIQGKTLELYTDMMLS